jgi:hypothetical protein
MRYIDRRCEHLDLVDEGMMNELAMIRKQTSHFKSHGGVVDMPVGTSMSSAQDL